MRRSGEGGSPSTALAAHSSQQASKGFDASKKSSFLGTNIQGFGPARLSSPWMKSRNAKGVPPLFSVRRNWIRFAALDSMNNTLPVARSASSAKVRADELPASHSFKSSLVRSCKAFSNAGKVPLPSRHKARIMLATNIRLVSSQTSLSCLPVSLMS